MRELFTRISKLRGKFIFFFFIPSACLPLDVKKKKIENRRKIISSLCNYL